MIHVFISFFESRLYWTIDIVYYEFLMVDFIKLEQHISSQQT